jgi:hypothetical protein
VFARRWIPNTAIEDSKATFEHLDQFARARGGTVHDLSTLPPGLHAASLTVLPFAFDLPENVSLMTHARTGNAISPSRAGTSHAKDRRRLLTMPTLAAFVRGIERTSETSLAIFVVAADDGPALMGR